MGNYSRQKTTILEIVEQHPHITIKEIREKAKSKVPSINMATIYRNLDKLEAKAKIQRVQIDRDLILYEKHKGPHHHFICTECSTVADLPDPQIDVCTSCLVSKHNFQISHINMNIFGICGECQL